MTPQGEGGIDDASEGKVTPVSKGFNKSSALPNLGGDVVLRLNAPTGALETVASGGGLAQVLGLTFGPDDHLYAVSVFTKKVVQFDGQTGAFLDVFIPKDRGGLKTSLGRAFGPDKDLLSVTRPIVSCCATRARPAGSGASRPPGTGWRSLPS